MPNWCYNHLTVTGDVKQLKEFVDKSTDKSLMHEDSESVFTFMGTMPIPKDLNITSGSSASQDEKEQAILNKGLYGYATWYDWCINEWGTKWDACSSDIQTNDKDQFTVSFETAWSPPVDWLGTTCKNYPELVFEMEYEEPGMGYAGTSYCSNGEYEESNWDIVDASECCHSEVFTHGDDKYSLSQIPLNQQMTWLGPDKTWKTLEDIPNYIKYPDHQCGKCGEECDTESINTESLKTATV